MLWAILFIQSGWFVGELIKKKIDKAAMRTQMATASRISYKIHGHAMRTDWYGYL